MTVLAHLSDIHLPPPALPALSSLRLKQLLGVLNWIRSRRTIHTTTALDFVLNDLDDQEFDHLIVSGDLVNFGLREEFEAGAAWLHGFERFATKGRPVTEFVSFVPGNHDYYDGPEGFYSAPFADFMRSDAVGASLGGAAGPDAPFVRIVDQVALIGMNSAIETPLFKAYGEVADSQLHQLGKILKKARDNGFYRCVFVHHPPLSGTTSDHRMLLNDRDFEKVLKVSGAELVLYGHNHVQATHRFDTYDGPCAIVGCPSASVGRVGRYDLARYNLFHIEKTTDGWHTQMTGRALDQKLDRVIRAEQWDFPGV